jgi:hypothetical protein
MADTLDPKDLLKPRDPATLPQGPGRSPSALYPALVQAFVASGEQAMDVDVKRIGRKPDTVRQALQKAIVKAGLKGKMRVGRYGEEVVLIKL